MSYIKDNFLLKTKTAEKLYETYAKNMPIFDYHCHLPEKQILENKPFNDVFEIWLSGDHYKWRLMRNYGVDEELITGASSTNKEKFLVYCKTLGTAFGNPLYHWSQVELKDFFNCESLAGTIHLALRVTFSVTAFSENTQRSSPLYQPANTKPDLMGSLGIFAQ